MAYFWTNLAANIAVNCWNVDHVYAVCDHVGLKYLTGKLRDRSLLMWGEGGGRETLKGVKTISDCLEGGLNFFMKKFRGVCLLTRQLNFTQNEQSSDKNTKFIISKK